MNVSIITLSNRDDPKSPPDVWAADNEDVCIAWFKHEFDFASRFDLPYTAEDIANIDAFHACNTLEALQEILDKHYGNLFVVGHSTKVEFELPWSQS